MKMSTRDMSSSTGPGSAASIVLLQSFPLSLATPYIKMSGRLIILSRIKELLMASEIPPVLVRIIHQPHCPNGSRWASCSQHHTSHPLQDLSTDGISMGKGFGVALGFC